MRVMIFNTKPFERELLDTGIRPTGHEAVFIESLLTPVTAPLAAGSACVSAFVNDDLGRETLRILAEGGTKYVALRCAGFNQVDLEAADEMGIRVARVPAYSPYAVAEHTVGLILTLNRNIHRAFNRVRESNFSLNGLMGFDMHGKTVGVVGTGKIGEIFATIINGFGCRLLGYDVRPNPACKALGMRYATLDELFAESDIISLHCPLTPETHHLIDDAAVAKMKPGVMIVNTSRGGVVDTRALIRGLKSERVGSVALDVYEEEGDLFFRDLSDTVLHDDLFARLLTFPNVLITAHQAFFTREAVQNIVDTTVENIIGFAAGDPPAPNLVQSARHVSIRRIAKPTSIEAPK